MTALKRLVVDRAQAIEDYRLVPAMPPVFRHGARMALTVEAWRAYVSWTDEDTDRSGIFQHEVAAGGVSRFQPDHSQSGSSPAGGSGMV
jgi:hypothetical protein